MTIIVDMHCDTITELIEKNQDILKNNLHIDLQRMMNIGNYVQFFAIYLDVTKLKIAPKQFTINTIEQLKKQINTNENIIEFAYSYSDIEKNINKNKCTSILTIEGGEALQGEIKNLKYFYDLGVRSIGLTWNNDNEIGCSIKTEKDIGLNSFGLEVVKEMNNLGMIIDVSHLSEKSFWDVIETTKQPIIASHSNAREICNHKRNLTNEQIKAIAKNNGVIGMNYYPFFLQENGNASIIDVIKQIEYISGLVGTDIIGLGSDFDGFNDIVKGLEDISKVPDILNELAKSNYSQKDIDKIAGGNTLRVMKEVIR